MASAWERIEQWLAGNAPAIGSDLRPGAPADAIAAAERELGVSLPDGMKRLYARHDGSAQNAPPLMGEWTFMSLQYVVQEWQMLKEVADSGAFEGLEADADPRIAPGWWNPGWIPIAHNSSGDYQCVDTAPGSGGTAGQVIGYWHADTRREWLAADVDAWLNAFADALEAGRYRVVNGRLERS